MQTTCKPAVFLLQTCCNVAAFLLHIGVLLLLCGVLSACLPAATREDLRRDWNKGLEQWRTTNWSEVGTDLTGLKVSRLYQPNLVNADNRTLCLRGGAEERVLAENGSSDSITYRRCPVSPYPTISMGERLSPGHVNPVGLNHPLN